MAIDIHPMRGPGRTSSSLKIALSLTAALTLGFAQSTYATPKKPNNGARTFMVFNIWNKDEYSKIWDQDALNERNFVFNDTMKNLLKGSKPDSLVMPELYNNDSYKYNKNITDAFERNTLEALNELPNKSEYAKPGALDKSGKSIVFSKKSAHEAGKNTIKIDSESGFPSHFVKGHHFDYADGSDRRIEEAKKHNDFVTSAKLPTIALGDYNAGELSERGLEDGSKQAILFARHIVDSGMSDFQKKLAKEYIPEGHEEAFNNYIEKMQSTADNGTTTYRNVLKDYLTSHPDEFPGTDSISNMEWPQWEEVIVKDMQSRGLVFEDETYPVEHNTPVTLNILKKHNELIQLERNRERFIPSQVGDNRATWPSNGEEDTNTWKGWDRVKIDHIMVSQPFAKWVQLVDRGEWSGNLSDKAKLPNGGSLSDHEPVAQTLAWVGPVPETYQAQENGESVSKTRLVWGEEAPIFDDADGEFLLTRNNMRDDVRLGQVADENGMPILTDLTTAEKKKRLDCSGGDPRFAQAVADYCIDDHSFIGETRVSDGTLIIVNDAALGTPDADLVLNGGNLRVAGTDTTKLDRHIVLDGQGGGLDIANAGHTVVVDKPITGSGDLAKLGAGTLRLENKHRYTGETHVRAGVLIVDGSIASSSRILIGADGMLRGSGDLGSVSVARGGMLAPGNSIGTTIVDGDVTFGPGSLFQVEVDPATDASDRIDASGKAVLDGGTVAHIGFDGSYGPVSTYRILNAEDGVEGEFDKVTSNYAFLDPKLIYNTNAVDLQLERNATAYVDMADTDNQKAAAKGIDSVGAGSDLYDSIVMMPRNAKQIQAGFDAISGEIYGSIQSGLVTSGKPIRSSVNERLRTATETKPDASVSQVSDLTMPAPKKGTGAWFNIYNNRTDFSATAEATSFSQDSSGIVMGLDSETRGWRFGLIAGVSQNDFSGGRGASGDSNNFTIGAYSGTQWDALGLRLGVSQSWHDVSTSRHVAVGNFTDSLNADYNARSTQVFGELGYEIRTNVARIEPFVNLAHVYVATDSFSESGGDAALSADSGDMSTTFNTLGIRGQTALSHGPNPIKATAMVGWRHAYSDLTGEATHHFAGGDDFTVSGSRIGEDATVVEAGLSIPVSNRASLGISYHGQFSAETDKHGMQGRFNWRF
ncbi:autotransporter outer membrane beta-barrel domain-containing protein [Salinisphaera orenii]|uniref:autotransporter outer membrane beta-barrel domain-containing protein n=1 Tax=Salinisphaera orenii TaxID=856731 RepID=UPI000DBE2E0D